MALYRNPQFDEMEKRFLNGVDFQNGVHSFNLTLSPIEPFPRLILDYKWYVTLSDGCEFEVKMAPDTLSYPKTRLEIIINALKKADRYELDYLANAINDKIDEVYREYR